MLSTAAFAMFALGHGIGQSLNDHTVTQIWNVVRWPIALVLMMSAIALLFRWSPRRHQPAWSWLAFGSTVSVLLWSLVTLGLGFFFQASTTFSTTYGPLAGMIAILLWSLLSSIAILFGAAIAVQLEAVRAGAAAPKDERKVDVGLRAGLAGAVRHLLTMPLSDWFLTAPERGNPATEIDRRHGDGTAWTEGNAVTVLVDGARVLRRLYEVLCATAAPATGCQFTDWQGDPDERARRVRAPRSARCSRSSPRRASRSAGCCGARTRDSDALRRGQEPRVLRGRQRGRRRGAARRAGAARRQPPPEAGRGPARAIPHDDVAFVGGIDLCHGRHDDARHLGDPQAVELDDRTTASARRGTTSSSRCAVRPSATSPSRSASVGTIRHPLDSPQPAAVARCTASRANPDASGTARHRRARPHPAGPHAVQVLRTYPAKRPPYPFAPEGRAQHRPRVPQGVLAGRVGSSTSRTSTSGRWHAAEALARRARDATRPARSRS